MAWYSADGQIVGAARHARRWPARAARSSASVTAFDGGLVAGGMSDLNGDGRGGPACLAVDRRADLGPASAALPMSEGEWDAARDLEVQSLSFGPTAGLIAAGGNEWQPMLWQSTDGGVTWAELPDPVHGEPVPGRRVAPRRGVARRRHGGDRRRAQRAAPRRAPMGGRLGGRLPEERSATVRHVGRHRRRGHHDRRRRDCSPRPSGDAREAFAGQLWRRTGDGWEALDSTNLAAGHVLDVASFAGGFVAVGLEDFGLASKRVTVTDTNPDGLMWLSRNGTDWARFGVADARVNEEMLGFIDDPSQAGLPAAIEQLEREAPPLSVEPAGGDGTRSLAAVSAYGDGFIAVGSVYYGGDAEPIILMSPDGVNVGSEYPPHVGPGHPAVRRRVRRRRGQRRRSVGAGGTNGAYDVVRRVPQARGRGRPPAVRSPAAATSGPTPAPRATTASSWWAPTTAPATATPGCGRRPTVSSGPRSSSSILGGTGDQWASAVAPVPGGGWLVAGTDRATGDGDIALWRIDSSGDVTRRDRGERALRGPGEQTVSSMDIDEDGDVTLAGNDYGRVGLWESSSGRPLTGDARVDVAGPATSRVRRA